MAQGKSPFELRADLLKLAFSILQAQHCAKAVGSGNDKIDTAPTSENVINEAEKLNDFISKPGNGRREK